MNGSENSMNLSVLFRMHRKLFLTLAVFLLHVESVQAELPTVKRYPLLFSEEQRDKIRGSFPGVASGLALLSNSSSAVRFLAAADNGSCLLHGEAECSPYFLSLKLANESLTVEIMTPIPGLNTNADLEGIALLSSEHVLLSDELHPSLIKLDPFAVEKLWERKPGEAGLPEILSRASENRGFEGLAVKTDDTVVVAVQTTLDLGGDTDSESLVTRIVEYDPEWEQAKMYAVIPELELYNSSADVRISALEVIDGNNFLILERGELANGGYSSRLYLLTNQGATDLSTLPEDRQPEKAKSYTELFQKFGVTPLKKTLLLNLNHLGWEFSKSEGLALMPDRKTIAIVNDADPELNETVELWMVTFPTPFF